MRSFPTHLLTRVRSQARAAARTAAVVAALATTAALLTLTGASADAPPPGGAAASATRPDAPDPDDPHTWQTSDQVPGEIAAPMPEYQRGLVDRDLRYRYDVVPGVRAVAWDETDARGQARIHLLRVDWKAHGIKLDYAHGPAVQRNEAVKRMVGRTPRAVAGVNGDFFDIGDTGAPLGVGRARGEGLLNGIDFGWNAAFWFGQRGRPGIGILNMAARVVTPDRTINVTNVNSPQVKPGGIGIYTPRWGWASGLRWTDGQRSDVRLVHVVDGKVVENRGWRFPDDQPFTGYYVVARGEEVADRLRRMRIGTKVKTRWRLPEAPPMAITGNQIVLQDRKVVATDDRDLHPRTAIGIDYDRHQILIMVVDGRQDFSRGYTMVEVARRLREFGAEAALNFDGGGSSTMVAKRGDRLRVLNSPSDGQQRRVPNGVQVVYKPYADRRR